MPACFLSSSAFEVATGSNYLLPLAPESRSETCLAYAGHTGHNITVESAQRKLKIAHWNLPRLQRAPGTSRKKLRNKLIPFWFHIRN